VRLTATGSSSWSKGYAIRRGAGAAPVNQYLYAIVDRLPTGWRPPTAGLVGASVVPRRLDDLVVVSSLLDTVPPAGPRTLALHQDVVATLMEASATLPFAYGTAVPAADLPGWLAVRQAEVRAALAAVRGSVEMSVKLLRLDGAIEPPRTRRHEHELRALADALTERAALPDWRYRPSGSAGNVAASLAFLVPRGEVAGFLARIAPVASHAQGVAVVPTGPWPPYSFVPDLARAPLARRPARPAAAGAGRAG
jgi:Gas vesicle synthesis protein GvpL/GvpF